MPKLPLTRCEAGKFAPVRLAGAPPEPTRLANRTPRKEQKLATALAERERDAWPSRCCMLSERSAPWKASGLALRKRLGHRALRRLAGFRYPESFGAPSFSWDWATASLLLPPAQPLSRASPVGTDLNVRAPSVKPAHPLPTVNRTTGSGTSRGDGALSATRMPLPTDPARP